MTRNLSCQPVLLCSSMIPLTGEAASGSNATFGHVNPEANLNYFRTRSLDAGLSGTIVNEQQYPLMTGDEIARTFARDDPQKRQLVMIAGKRIMILERYEYFND